MLLALFCVTIAKGNGGDFVKELKVSELTKTYGDKTLFDQISFLIHERDRVGLIGVNGTGKTSLLTILSGKENGDGDKQTIFYPTNYRIGYLSQNTTFDPEQTVLEAVFQGESEQLKTVKRYERALLALEYHGDREDIQREYTLAEEAMNEQDAWLTDTNAKIILQKLGIHQLDKKIKSLSGGQQKRVGLAQVLIDEPDLLLLDEPTNHLDYEAIQWLESYLNQYRGALLMVTHDRYFLDRVTNRIFELSFGKLHEYQGNYEAYILERAERERVEGEQEQKRKQLYKQELAWMRAGAKARTTKQQARINRFEDLKENVHQVKTNGEVEIDIATKRLGKKVLEIKDGQYKIGQQDILKHFDLLIQTKERLGITGENGAGKSTLLNILAGRIPLDAGELIIGETVRLAYYTQQNEAMDANQRMIAYLQEAAEEVRRSDGSQISVAEMLERFLFPRFMHGTKIGKLSGGEKRRLYLLKLLIGQPNVLLLDEPTNDLDIDTLTILEDYLQSFPGAVITVSHDRYFLDKVAEKLLIFQGDGEIDRYFGSINQYLAERTQPTSKPKIVEQEVVVQPEKVKKKLSYMEQKEWATIEDEIATLEETLETLTEEMNHQGDNFTRLQELQNDVTLTEEKLNEKMERWEYLSELADN
ncbi:ABC-F family ATP-binding cassette domain-containing protein [Enterococcus saccharolyticus]|nr:ABC-F family ATP-binding cassette domain-containing protein [Enterococcus saccharolyticus]